MNGEKIEVEKGSGNVFKDLGLPNPEERLAKAHLVFKIEDIITERGFRRGKAAKILGISRSELSMLRKGRLANYSLDYLFSLLEKLDRQIEVIVHKRPANTPPAGMRISAAAD